MLITYYEVSSHDLAHSPLFLTRAGALAWIRAIKDRSFSHGFTGPKARLERMGGDLRDTVTAAIHRLTGLSEHHPINEVNRSWGAYHGRSDLWFGWTADVDRAQVTETVSEDLTSVSYTAPVLVSYLLQWEHVIQAERQEEGYLYVARKTERRSETLVQPTLLLECRIWDGHRDYFLSNDESSWWQAPRGVAAEVWYSINEKTQEFVD